MAYDESYLDELLSIITPVVDPEGMMEDDEYNPAEEVLEDEFVNVADEEPMDIPDAVAPAEESVQEAVSPSQSEEMTEVSDSEVTSETAEQSESDIPEPSIPNLDELLASATSVAEAMAENLENEDEDEYWPPAENPEAEALLNSEEPVALSEEDMEALLGGDKGNGEENISADDALTELTEVDVAEPEPVVTEDNAVSDANKPGQDAAGVEELQTEEPQEISLDMSEEEIEAMLNAAREVDMSDIQELTLGEDVIELSDDPDLKDIQQLLDNDANGVVVDESMLQKATSEAEVLTGEETAPVDKKAEREARKAEKKRKKEEKKKNRKNKGKEGGSEADTNAEVSREREWAPISAKGGGDQASEGADLTVDALLTGEEPQAVQGGGGSVATSDADSAKSKDKKPGLLAKILEFLTATDEDDDKAENKVPEEIETVITDENKDILAELDKEDKKKKGKKKSKKKDKKGGKGDGDAPGEGKDGEDDEVVEVKKKKKEKKKKPPKVKEVDDTPQKKLPKKKVRVTFLLCFTILAAVLLAVNTLTNYNNLRDARWAYDNQDYKTAYEDLYGLELKESDQEIYDRSFIIMSVQRKWDSYNNYSKLGMDEQALSALIEAVGNYPVIRERAEALGVEAQTDYIYSRITDALGGYGINENDAKEIAGYESRVKYTKRIRSIVNHTDFDYEDSSSQGDEAPASGNGEGGRVLQDVLDEERDFLPEDVNSIFE
ncbi:MAG: hypothetical protein K5662_03960 [Lachnospiraceae bacterium]|nr:hypothetical protein [Lachnospiraceae bacterium]